MYNTQITFASLLELLIRQTPLVIGDDFANRSQRSCVQVRLGRIEVMQWVGRTWVAVGRREIDCNYAVHLRPETYQQFDLSATGIPALYWTTVTSNNSPYVTGPLSCLSCLSVCLSVTLAYCVLTVGWIKMSFGIYGGRPWPRRHCVRWRPSSPTERGIAAPPIFGPCLLLPKGRPSQQLLSSC